MIVEIGVQVRAAVLVCREQTPLLPQRAADEIDGMSRGVGEIRPMQHAGGDRESADRERVPRGQDLLVSTGPDAQRPRGEELCAGRFDQRGRRAARLVRSLERAAHAQVPAALEIGCLIEAEPAREHRVLGLAQSVAHFGRGPYVEQALVPLPSPHPDSSKSRLAASACRGATSPRSPPRCARTACRR